jgi:two-component sensor histidine kinase
LQVLLLFYFAGAPPDRGEPGIVVFGIDLAIDERIAMSLGLDIHTILCFLVAVSALGAVLLALDASKGATLYDLAFITGLVLQSLSWTLIALRGIASDFLTFYVANSLQFLGMALIGLSLVSTRTKITRGWILVYAAALAYTLFCWWVPGLEYKMHIILISLAYPVFFGLPGALIARDSWRRSPMQLFFGAFLMLYSAGMLFRGVSLLLGGKYDLFSGGVLQLLVLFAFALVLNMITLGYILMKKENANDQLKELSEARNVLLSELQHRIKNSLAIISSLTSLESASHDDPVLRATLQKMSDRIRAVAGLYNQLIVEALAEGVYIDAYIRDLAGRLGVGYAAESRQIRMEFELEHVRVGAKEAVSIGLVINELVTNAIKYAFPEGRPGSIFIGFASRGAESSLVVRDDGVGAKADPQGLGTAIVSTLAQQLGGTVSYSRDGGTRVELRFRQSR